jgi:hypothetical protein
MLILISSLVHNKKYKQRLPTHTAYMGSSFTSYRDRSKKSFPFSSHQQKNPLLEAVLDGNMEYIVWKFKTERNLEFVKLLGISFFRGFYSVSHIGQITRNTGNT